MSVVDALVAVGLVESRNAARRVIGEGGASVNGRRSPTSSGSSVADDVLHGEVVVLRRGARTSPRDGPAPATLTGRPTVPARSIWRRRTSSSNLVQSAREGGTDAKRRDADPAPSRPVPRADSPPGQRLSVVYRWPGPSGPGRPASPRSGFDRDEAGQVTWSGCPGRTSPRETPPKR